jgi:hypothetical protein
MFGGSSGTWARKSSRWCGAELPSGRYPSGLFGLLLLVVVIVALTRGDRGVPPL